jgi:hypothetical protein
LSESDVVRGLPAVDSGGHHRGGATLLTNEVPLLTASECTADDATLTKRRLVKAREIETRSRSSKKAPFDSQDGAGEAVGVCKDDKAPTDATEAAKVSAADTFSRDLLGSDEQPPAATTFIVRDSSSPQYIRNKVRVSKLVHAPMCV